MKRVVRKIVREERRWRGEMGRKTRWVAMEEDRGGILTNSVRLKQQSREKGKKSGTVSTDLFTWRELVLASSPSKPQFLHTNYRSVPPT